MSESVRRLFAPLVRPGEDELVFRGTTGSPLDKKNVANRVLGPKCREADVPVVGWNSFRHSHATLQAELGESIKTTQAILGHSDLDATLNPSPIPESQSRAIERVAEILDPNGLTSENRSVSQRIN